MKTLQTFKTYPALRDAILQVLEAGKERARQAVEREKVVTYQQVGRILHEHFLEHKERANYGDNVIAKLAEDIGIGERRLYEMLKFYRCFPILRPVAELGWSHYTALLSLSERSERAFYLRAAARNRWSRRELREQIRAGAFAQAKEIQPVLKKFEPRRGQLYTYRTVAGTNGLDVDLGFRIYRPVPTLPKNLEAGRIVRVHKDGDGYRLTRSRSGGLHTYTGVVERVVDGDTLWVKIDCGFETYTRQKLRLRGLDTPELPSVAGQRARDFVQAAVGETKFVVVSTTKPDKYDRYLADVFFLAEGGQPERVLEAGTCLNTALLDRGFAKVFEG